MAARRFMTSAYGRAEGERASPDDTFFTEDAAIYEIPVIDDEHIPSPRERNKMKKPSGTQTDGSAQSLVDMVAIDRLANIVKQYDLTEVDISLGELRVRLARHRSPSPQRITPAPETEPVTGNPEQGSDALPVITHPPPVDLAGAVKSPMVGTAYLRSSPEAKPFVEVGSVVKIGDKLLLVEAMKTFNDIVAPRAGKVAGILVVDGAPVEYDQPLMIIE